MDQTERRSDQEAFIMTNQDILILLDSIKLSIREGRISLALEKIGVLQDKLEDKLKPTKEE